MGQRRAELKHAPPARPGACCASSTSTSASQAGQHAGNSLLPSLPGLRCGLLDLTYKVACLPSVHAPAWTHEKIKRLVVQVAVLVDLHELVPQLAELQAWGGIVQLACSKAAALDPAQRPQQPPTDQQCQVSAGVSCSMHVRGCFGRLFCTCCFCLRASMAVCAIQATCTAPVHVLPSSQQHTVNA